MTKLEVNAIVAEAIEELFLAQPPRPCAERTAHREKAGELMLKLKRRDFLKVDDELLTVLGNLS